MRTRFIAVLLAALMVIGTTYVYTATQNYLPKYDTAGNLVDSAVREVDGKVGIGTSTPGGHLHISGTATEDLFAGMGPDLLNGPAFNFGYAGGSFGRSAGFFNVRPDVSASAPNPSLRFMTANVQRVIITNTGNVGIGTLSPEDKLHVAGSIKVDGNINAKYQDVAEWVDATEPLPAGTVVIVAPDAINGVARSDAAYSESVAGVISAQPGVVLGEAAAGKVLVAQSGRVRVRVDASFGAIRQGDLLVSSPTRGHAMKSRPLEVGTVRMHRPGTILGKALEALPGGKGEILVLLTLQ